MNRYFSSFFIAFFFYTILLFCIFYFILNNEIIIKKTEEAKLISLNHIELVPEIKQEVVKIEEQKKEIEKEIEKVVEKSVEIPKPVIQKKIEKLKEEKVIEKKSVEKQEFKPIKEVEKVVDNTVVEKTKTEEKQLEVKPIIDDKKDYLDKHLAQIRELINKNVKYPSKAKKLSIEGIVIVKFKILEDGTVQNIEIIQGDKFLQTSTIEAIEEASKNFPKTNQNIEIQVPIEYKLI